MLYDDEKKKISLTVVVPLNTEAEVFFGSEKVASFSLGQFLFFFWSPRYLSKMTDIEDVKKKRRKSEFCNDRYRGPVFNNERRKTEMTYIGVTYIEDSLYAENLFQSVGHPRKRGDETIFRIRLSRKWDRKYFAAGTCQYGSSSAFGKQFYLSRIVYKWLHKIYEQPLRQGSQIRGPRKVFVRPAIASEFKNTIFLIIS